MKIAIKVLNEKHNRVTQELLFKHGYSWCGDGDKNVMRFNGQSSSCDTSFIQNSYLELKPLNHALYYCSPSQDKYRWADTFLRLKELKNYLQNN